MIKSYFFYVRKYSIFTNDYELYVYKCKTADPFHVMGEMLYRSMEKIERINFNEVTPERENFWQEQNKKIYTWFNKY